MGHRVFHNCINMEWLKGSKFATKKEFEELQVRIEALEQKFVKLEECMKKQIEKLKRTKKKKYKLKSEKGCR